MFVYITCSLVLIQVATVASLSSQQVIQYTEILQRLIQLLRDGDLGTAKQSALILVQLCTYDIDVDL